MRIDNTNRTSSDALTDLMSSDLMAGGGTEMAVAAAAAQLDEVRQRSRAASRESRTEQRQAQREKLGHERKAAALKLVMGLTSSVASIASSVVSISQTAAQPTPGGAKSGGEPRAKTATGGRADGPSASSPSTHDPGDCDARPAPAASQKAASQKAASQKAASQKAASQKAASTEGSASWSQLIKPAGELSNAIVGYFESNQERDAEGAGFEADAAGQAAKQEEESAQAAEQGISRALSHADQIAELIHRARMAEISG